MKDWNTTTRYHWSVTSARRNTKKGVRKTLRNKIAERNMDQKHENAVRYRSEKKKFQNNPNNEPRNIFTAACPPLKARIAIWQKRTKSSRSQQEPGMMIDFCTLLFSKFDSEVRKDILNAAGRDTSAKDAGGLQNGTQRVMVDFE